MIMEVLPVIHIKTKTSALRQLELVLKAGADGAFFISHMGEDKLVVDVADDAKRFFEDAKIGINLLSMNPVYACGESVMYGLDMVWGDDMGFDSVRNSQTSNFISRFAMEFPEKDVFASVAFKYRPKEQSPTAAAARALGFGFVPTTSGEATGSPPSVEKVAAMSKVVGGRLAVASGLTPENIKAYAPYISHALVATGISKAEGEFDEGRLREFIAEASRAVMA